MHILYGNAVGVFCRSSTCPICPGSSRKAGRRGRGQFHAAVSRGPVSPPTGGATCSRCCNGACWRGRGGGARVPARRGRGPGRRGRIHTCHSGFVPSSGPAVVRTRHPNEPCLRNSQGHGASRCRERFCTQCSVLPVVSCGVNAHNQRKSTELFKPVARDAFISSLLVGCSWPRPGEKCGLDLRPVIDREPCMVFGIDDLRRSVADQIPKLCLVHTGVKRGAIRIDVIHRGV